MDENRGSGFQSEVLSRLDDLKREKVPQIPLLDPTENVKTALAAEVKRINDLRDNDDRWTTRLREVEDRCGKEKDELKEKLRVAESNRIDAVNLAERNRIDANVAQGKADIALASEKASATAVTLANSVVASAKALSDAAIATTALQDRRLTALEQNQYQGVGAAGQRTESRGTNQWTIGIVITVVFSGMALLLTGIALILKFTGHP
jgi:hypothetical protein